MSWLELAEWWLAESKGDPAYGSVVTPLTLEILRPEAGRVYLELGCGDGRVMETIRESGSEIHGVDLNFALATRARHSVVARLPEIPMRSDVYDGVVCVLTLEHIDDIGTFFTEAARVSVMGGVMALVINHPVWTAPDSTPITDEDGEVLWRPGEYFSAGVTEVPAGKSSVTFHHRTMAELLNAASQAGWTLEEMRERPHHEFEDQAGIPRLLACRWRLLP